MRGLKRDEKYMAAVAAYNEHGKLIGGSIGQTCRPVLAAHPLPTLMAWGYLAQVRNNKLQRVKRVVKSFFVIREKPFFRET